MGAKPAEEMKLPEPAIDPTKAIENESKKNLKKEMNTSGNSNDKKNKPSNNNHTPQSQNKVLEVNNSATPEMREMTVITIDVHIKDPENAQSRNYSEKYIAKIKKDLKSNGADVVQIRNLVYNVQNKRDYGGQIIIL